MYCRAAGQECPYPDLYNAMVDHDPEKVVSDGEAEDLCEMGRLETRKYGVEVPCGSVALALVELKEEVRTSEVSNA
jgi:hypothetical protein